MTDGAERIVFSGQVDALGHIRPESVNVVKGRLAKWKGRKVTVCVSRYVRSKTNAQLATFHGPVLEAFAEYCGDYPDEVKKDLKRAYLTPQLKVSRFGGAPVPELPSLEDLTVEEMSAFLDRCLMEGRKLGIEFRLDAA